MDQPSIVLRFKSLVETNRHRLEGTGSLLKAFSWLMGGYSGQIAFGVLQSIFLARLLGLTMFGVYVAIFSMVTTLAQIIVSKTAQFVIREYTTAIDESDKNKAAAAVKFAYGVETASGLLVFSVICAASGLLSTYLAHDLAPAGIIAFAAIILIADLGTDTSQSLLMARRRFHAVSLGYILQSGIMALTAGACFLAREKSMALIFTGVIVAYAVRAAMLHFQSGRELRKTLGSGWRGAPVREAGYPLGQWFGYIFKNNLGDGLTVLTKSGTLWLAFLAGPQPTALYKIADNVGGLIYLGMKALGDASYPDIVRLINRRDSSILKHELVRYAVIGTAGATSVGVVLALASPIILDIFYGNTFADAYPSILILLAGGVICAGFYWAPGLLLAKGRPGLMTTIKTFASIVQIPLMALLIPWGGQVGAAIAVSISRAFLVIWLAVTGIRTKPAT